MTTMELEASLYHASDHNLIMNGIMSNGSKSLATTSGGGGGGGSASSSPEETAGVASSLTATNVSARRRKVFFFSLNQFSPSFFSFFVGRPRCVSPFAGFECKHERKRQPQTWLQCLSVNQRCSGRGACHQFVRRRRSQKTRLNHKQIEQEQSCWSWALQ